MKVSKFYKLKYPMFRVNYHEYKRLQDLLHLYDKGEIQNEFLCTALLRVFGSGGDPAFEALRNKINSAVYGSVLNRRFGFPYNLDKHLNTYLRHIWLRKLLNYNHRRIHKTLKRKKK